MSDPMFEQEIAHALKDLRADWRPPHDRKMPDLMDWLAPRIAAAIDAARTIQTPNGSTMEFYAVDQHAAALEALRAVPRSALPKEKTP